MSQISNVHGNSDLDMDVHIPDVSQPNISSRNDVQEGLEGNIGNDMDPNVNFGEDADAQVHGQGGNLQGDVNVGRN